ncbi:hypothetical protein CBS101457_003941 [Exobasidium rhododendri]|nr:hypothetical protein CBS101457_003941 [Exobasidium rhododendri]
MSASSEIPLEEVEEALSGLSRDALVMALKRAKEQMDILDSKLDTYIGDNERLHTRVADLSSQVNLAEAEAESMQIALLQREERVDELMKEQDRDEEEVYAKTGIIERLRLQLEESEKGRKETERRYLDQTATSDKERQYYSDMEALLQTQKSKASTAHERILSSNQELLRENERLQIAVSQLRHTTGGYLRSSGAADYVAAEQDTETSHEGNHSGLSSSAAAISTEEPDTAESGKGYRLLQAEAKTLEIEALQADFSALQKSHYMLNAHMQHCQLELTQAKTINAELQEQNETYMDILQEKTFSGALIEESAVLNRKYVKSDTEESDNDTDDVDDVPDEPRMQQRSKRRALRTKRSQAILNNLPQSLANELETSDSDEEGTGKDARKRERRRERSEMLSDNVEELHKEIWNLRDANQALTLYVTKILDRIISKEGYENVLAVDGDEKSRLGTLRGTPNRLRHQRSRPSLFENQTPIGNKATKRASSGGLLSLLGGSTVESKEEGSTQDTPTSTKSPSFVARAKRTASIDWRFLLGNGSPTPTNQQPLPTSLNSTTHTTNEGLEASMSPAPRKISSSEEVEDYHDEEEKEKIRRAMISHGISLPENQLKSQKRASGFGTFFTRVMGANTATTTITSAAAAAATTTTPDGSASSNKEDVASMTGRGDQHSGLTGTAPGGRTPDSASTRPGRIGSNGETAHDGKEAEQIRSSSPESRNKARQNALDAGEAGGNLTEVPRRVSPISSRRSILKRRDTASTGVEDSSRGESLAGDESYVLDSLL